MVPTLLTVPGYTGSGPGHWQTLWERRDRAIRRVIQADWDDPSCRAWVEGLDRAVRGVRAPVVLIAHSLGCATVAHWLQKTEDPGAVVGAMLVAPADVDRGPWPVDVSDFRPMPTALLGVESTVVASQDDPWVEPARAERLARSWGSRFVDVGERGHLNTASGLGEWPEGRGILGALLTRCGLELPTLEDP